MPGAPAFDFDAWFEPSWSSGWGWWLSRLGVGAAFLLAHVIFGFLGVVAVGLALVGFLFVLSLLRAALEPVAGRSQAVHATFRVNAQPIGDRVLGQREAAPWADMVVGWLCLAFGVGAVVAVVGSGVTELVFLALTPLFMGLECLARVSAAPEPEAPVGLDVERAHRGFMVRSREGAAQHVGAEGAVYTDGRVQVQVSVVEQFSLPRFLAEQATLVFPLVMLAVTVLTMQVMFVVSLLAVFFAPPPAPGLPEPSPEYLTRLLNGDTAGADKGVVAIKREARPDTETKIESYYLPSGSDGPITTAGGAKHTGSTPRAGDPRSQKSEDVTIQVVEIGTTEALQPQDAPEAPTIEDLVDPLATADGKQDEFKESVEVNEGWGLSDWYDTEDARKDAKEIQQAIDLSNQVLKLDPDNLYGLSIKAYYQYLAMNFDGATATYDHMLQIDGTSGAEWNNLALVYKRLGDYQKEEELYHTAIMMEPNESNTYLNLALCLGHQGRFDESMQIFKKLETDIPPGDENEGYADLYRAQVYAMMGKKEEAYRYLRTSLKLMRKLDTLHNIEFQQDIRIDPAFKEMREEARFKRLLMRYYGEKPGAWWQLKGDEPPAAPGEEP